VTIRRTMVQKKLISDQNHSGLNMAMPR
jgi:hypothetical protein